MQTVTVRRTIDAHEDAVRAAMADTEAFLRAGGFDEVTVDGDDIHLANSVGLLTIELDLVATEEPGSDLVYEQESGIFESMVTRFSIESEGAETDGMESDGMESDGVESDRAEMDRAEMDRAGVTVKGETDFALDASLVGPILDATIIKRQRRKELEGHFDFLEERATRGTPEPDGQKQSRDA